MKLKRLAAGLLTGMCIVSMFTGCSGADKKTDTDNNKNSKTETSYMTPSHSDDILAFTLVPDYDSAIIIKIQDEGIAAKAAFKNADSVKGQYKYTGNIYNDKVDIVEYKRAKGSGNNAVPRIRFEYVCDAPRFELRCQNEYETKTRKAFLKDAKSTGNFTYGKSLLSDDWEATYIDDERRIYIVFAANEFLSDTEAAKMYDFITSDKFSIELAKKTEGEVRGYGSAVLLARKIVMQKKYDNYTFAEDFISEAYKTAGVTIKDNSLLNWLKCENPTGFSQPINDQDTYEENAFYIESLTEIIYNKYINDYPEEVTGVDIYKSVRKSSDGKKAVIITNTGDYFKLSNLNGDFSLFGL